MRRAASIGLIIAAAVAGCGAALLVPEGAPERAQRRSETASVPQPVAACIVKSKVARANGHLRPIIMADRTCRSDRLATLEREIQQELDQARASGTVFSAGFYLEHLNSVEWCGYNEKQVFMPGSLLKLPVLIAYLWMLEEGKVTLDQEFLVDTRTAHLPAVHVKLSTELVDGRSFALRELLEAMIGMSDNKALFTLLEHIDQPCLEKAYSDVGLPVPTGSDGPIPVAPEEFSRFWKVLYNSNTMSNGMSAFGLEDAIRSEFVHGIVGGVPPGTPVAHKFGEFEDGSGQQLHDSGIIYLQGAPYLLTIMTKGPDMRGQAQLMRDISAKVHSFMGKLASASAFVPGDPSLPAGQH